MSFANMAGEGHPALLHVCIRQAGTRDYRSSEGRKKVFIAETLYLCQTEPYILIPFILQDDPVIARF